MIKTCSKGHQFQKNSDCPVCPICEKEMKLNYGFLSMLSAPARRALESNDIDSLEKLSKYSVTEILNFHGLGKSSIPKLEKLLHDHGLQFVKK